MNERGRREVGCKQQQHQHSTAQHSTTRTIREGWTVTFPETTQKNASTPSYAHTRSPYMLASSPPRCLTHCGILTPRSNACAQALGRGSGAEGERPKDVQKNAPIHLLGKARRHQGRHRASHGVSHQREPVPAQGPCLEKQAQHQTRFFGIKMRGSDGDDGQVPHVEDACPFCVGTPPLLKMLTHCGGV